MNSTFKSVPYIKISSPGNGDTAVGGHVDYGENIQTALRREAREELGITLFEPVLIRKYIFESEIEKELVHTFFTLYDGEIHPDQDEVEYGRFWSISELEKNMGAGLFTPNFENEYRTVLHRLLISR